MPTMVIDFVPGFLQKNLWCRPIQLSEATQDEFPDLFSEVPHVSADFGRVPSLSEWIQNGSFFAVEYVNHRLWHYSAGDRQKSDRMDTKIERWTFRGRGIKAYIPGMGATIGKTEKKIKIELRIEWKG
jgi:hypothetical protein